MSVYKRKNTGRWVAQVHDATTGRARQIGTFATKREAAAAEREAIRKRLTSGVTVDEWAARWQLDFATPKPSTAATRRHRLAPLLREFGKRRMDSITVLEARTYALAHRDSYSVACTMWNDARRAGLLEQNPFSNLGVARGRGRRDLPSGWLPVEEVERIAALAPVALDERYGQIFGAAIIFAAWTGVRPGELYCMRWSDLGSDELQVSRGADSRTRTVGTPKNSFARTIVYPARAREAVEAMPRMHETELLFPSPRGKQFWANTFSRYWDKVRCLAGRPEMDLYELRHHCATQLLELGVSAADVAIQLGHRDGGKLVMSTYGHPSDVAARARVRAALDGYETGAVAHLRNRKAAG